MRALVQKLSPIQEAVLITTIFVGWFIYSAMSIAFAGAAAIQDGTVMYDNAAAIGLVVFESVTFAIGALVLRSRLSCNPAAFPSAPHC